MLRLCVVLACVVICDAALARVQDTLADARSFIADQIPTAQPTEANGPAGAPVVDLTDPFGDKATPSKPATPNQVTSDNEERRGKASSGTATGDSEAASQSNRSSPISANGAENSLPHLRTYTQDEILSALEKTATDARATAIYQYEKYEKLDRMKFQIETFGRKILECDDFAGRSPIRVKYSIKAKTALGEVQSVIERFLHKTEDGLKMDWPSSSGFSEQSVAAWKAGDGQSLFIRGELRITDDFRGPFAKASDKYYAVEVREVFADRGDRVVAYALKDSSVGKLLYDTLKDGDKHSCSVTISRATGIDTPMVIAVNSVNWFVGEGPPQAESTVAQQRTDTLRTAENGYKLPIGRVVSKEDVKKHNENVVAASMRGLVGQVDPGKILELNQNMEIFTKVFAAEILPAYTGTWPFGRNDAALDRVLGEVKQNPVLIRAIQWALDVQHLGDMWHIVGQEVKTYDEIWNECLLRMAKAAKTEVNPKRQTQERQVPEANSSDRALTRLSPEQRAVVVQDLQELVRRQTDESARTSRAAPADRRED